MRSRGLREDDEGDYTAKTSSYTGAAAVRVDIKVVVEVVVTVVNINKKNGGKINGGRLSWTRLG